jgi:hypothetical protein
MIFKKKAFDVIIRVIAYTSTAIVTLCKLHTRNLLKLDLPIPLAFPLGNNYDLWGPEGLEQSVLYP